MLPRGQPLLVAIAAAVTFSGPFPPETTMQKRSQPALDEPALGASSAFSDLGTVVTRVADGRHHYAKTSPWNCDESYALLLNGDLLDGHTYQRLKRVILPAEHRTWSNADPRFVYGLTYAGPVLNRWVRVDVATGVTTVLATYGEYRHVSYGEGEGNTDNEDRWAALIGDRTVPFLISARTGAKKCAIASKGQVSDATMSQDGRHVLVNWGAAGIDAFDTRCRFERHLSDASGHYDACVMLDGKTQVIVQAAGGHLVMTGISSGVTTTVYRDSALRVHVSCRNVRRPGWAYLSPYGSSADSVTTGQNMWQRGFAVKLDGSGAVQNFAWLHMPLPTHYDDAPMLVASPMGDRVWWKTNWDGASGGIRSFVARWRAQPGSER